MAQCRGHRAQMVRLFFLLFTYIWQKYFSKISKVPVALRNGNPARSITWLVSATIYCNIFQYQFISILPVFTLQYNFHKNLAVGIAH